MKLPIWPRKKSLIKILALSLGLSLASGAVYKYFTTHPYMNKVKKGDIFEGKEKTEFAKNYRIQFDQDRPIGVLMSYDLDKNGKVDTYAYYFVLFNRGNELNVDTKAKAIYVDSNEDGKIDYLLLDEDFNGTLEKKIDNIKV